MKVGEYIRTKDGIIDKVIIQYNGICASPSCNCKHVSCERDYHDEDKIVKSSPNIIDLIEYMDLLWIDHPVKLYDNDTTIGLFNPVRCDGFTEFEDGTHCIILNMDYIVDVNDLKIKSVLTHEQYEKLKYEVGDV